ncbi:MAG: hypothetical protein IT524_10930 [Nitrosomonas sp.]|uniref:hypothetical protein n=1 Tax=Nitrosomonas sp. JL21 TaxID=153949 RepID=UPI0013DE280E|nr:hypothetical protein [Nitrosomonas sp. JL21]MBL8496254.1 hypothetical protein [Nitrosomonas sp.]MCC7092446.1 hypothetical protein [Nitrosomonas sp.]
MTIAVVEKIVCSFGVSEPLLISHACADKDKFLVVGSKRMFKAGAKAAWKRTWQLKLSDQFLQAVAIEDLSA